MMYIILNDAGKRSNYTAMKNLCIKTVKQAIFFVMCKLYVFSMLNNCETEFIQILYKFKKLLFLFDFYAFFCFLICFENIMRFLYEFDYYTKIIQIYYVF